MQGGSGSGGSTSPRCDRPSNLQNGLVGHWPFCGNANDESGNGNDGVVNGATLTSDRCGNANSAYDFDGVDDGIDISSTSIDLFNYDIMTISCWVNIYGPGSNSNGGAIIGKYTQGDIYNSSFALQHKNNAALQAIGLGTDDWNSVDNVFTYGSWTHVVVEYNRLDSSVSIFANDVLITQGPLTYNNGNLADTLVTIGRVNAGTLGAPNSNHLHGQIDDIGIWDRALSTQEINQLYNNEFYSYSWSTGDTTASIDVSPSQTTTYSVTVSNGISSCTDSVTVSVSSPSVDLGTDTSASAILLQRLTQVQALVLIYGRQGRRRKSLMWILPVCIR